MKFFSASCLRFFATLFAIALASTTQAESANFKLLYCQQVAGNTLKIGIEDAYTFISLRDHKGSLVSQINFETRDCNFSQNFEINFDCKNQYNQFVLNRKQGSANNLGYYSEVVVDAFKIEDLDKKTLIINEVFSTRTVQGGKVARCIINGFFEVR